jgi:hypothetical protein
MPDFVKFANRYCDPVKKSDGIHYNGASFSDELNYIYRKRFALRRQRDENEFVQALPKVQRQKILSVGTPALVE